MTCDEVRALSGAYALRALPPDVARAVDEHVTGCNLHPYLAEVRAAAELLAHAAPEREPPAALRDRIMQAATGAVPSDAPSAPQRIEAARLSPASERARARWFGGYAVQAAAAAAAVLVVGLLLWNLVLLGSSDGDEALVRTSVEGLNSRLVYVPSERVAVLTVHGLDPAPAGRVYQAWIIRGGTPHGAGVFESRPDGEAQVVLPGQLAEGDAIAVTLEPAGGSTAPTGQPLLRVPV